MLTGLLLTLLALVGIIAIMVWIVQLPFVALIINIGLLHSLHGLCRGPFVALLAIVGFVAVILSVIMLQSACLSPWERGPRQGCFRVASCDLRSVTAAESRRTRMSPTTTTPPQTLSLSKQQSCEEIRLAAWRRPPSA